MAEVSPHPSAIPKPTTVTVLCCMCGIPIVPNVVNTCATCLASTSDITRGISTEATLHQCRGCQRWHKETGKWAACELESRELMSLCLNHVSGLKSSKHGQKVRLIDAAWIWTEPHSMRLKVRLTVQREVHTGTILQQSFTVVFIVRNQQCIECQAVFRQGSWKALVQVRQRVSHKRTFLYLEQLILKHGAHRGCLSIETFRDGMDFYFPDKSKAARFISFLENVCPIRLKTSKKLISTDVKSNIANYKLTNFVEICPLCKDDLLLLPAKTARNMGNISRLVLVKNISNLIQLIDPLTGQTAAMTSDTFWREPIRPLISAGRARMTRFVVLAKEPFFLRPNASVRRTNKKQRTRLASLTIAREGDLGVNDSQLEERSHIGYLLKSGDVCLAYDLKETQFVNDEAETMREAGKLPDVVVTRKLYGGAATGESDATKQRMWRLRRLEVDATDVNPGRRGARNATEIDDMDEEDFLQEVEADREMRLNMHLYKNELTRSAINLDDQPKRDDTARDAAGDSDDEDDQQVKLDELLEGLALEDGPDEAEEGDMALEDVVQDTALEIGFISREDARHVRDKSAAVAIAKATDDASFV